LRGGGNAVLPGRPGRHNDRALCILTKQMQMQKNVRIIVEITLRNDPP